MPVPLTQSRRQKPANGAVAAGERRPGHAVDVTLKRLLAAIEGGAADLISIDIFDTLLWRTLPYPTDAFHLLGRRLRQLRMLGPDVSPDLFWRLRQLAEVRAREHREGRGEGPEVILVEIYEELPKHLFGRFSR